MQQTGTRSTHLTIQSLESPFARWSEDDLHRVSKASKFQQWAFRTIQAFTEYKAAEYGIVVETVPPQHTSQRCSHVGCGFSHAANRDGDAFECQECRRKYHPD